MFEYDCMSSFHSAPCPLNWAKVSTPFAGHALIPETSPFVAEPFGPSTAAPASTGADPSSEPARLATWCWRQCGNVVPSPTMNDDPQALAPRMLASHRWL